MTNFEPANASILVRLAIENGIENSKIIFNGNGKTKIELLKAINYGVIINVDSKFDYDNLLEAKGTVLTPNCDVTHF